MSQKKIDPRDLPMVLAAREQRERILAEIEAAAKKPLRELRQRLALCEATLLEYDPEFTLGPRRLAHLSPMDAAIVILTETPGMRLPQEELISRMISDGVAFGHSHPRRSILSGLGRESVRSVLLHDDATGVVSLSDDVEQVRARRESRTKHWRLKQKKKQ